MGKALQQAMPGAADLPVLLGDAIEALTEGFAIFDASGGLALYNRRFRESDPALGALIRPGLRWEVLLDEAEACGVLSADAARRLRLAADRSSDAPPKTVEFETPAGRAAVATVSATDQGGLLLILRDVTARNRLRARRREADEVLRRVLEACTANVMMSRAADGAIIYRSPAATALLGGTGDYFADGREREQFLAALRPSGRVSDMAVTCLRANGEAFPCAVSARVIEYRREDVIVATVEDLSQQVAMERELAAQREIIFQAEKMSALGELLAGVAHELNNPLSVVVGHALMLREETADPEAVRRIEKIGQAAERCTRIVKSFLAMARQQPTALVPMDVAATVAAAVEAFEAGRPAGRTVSVRLDLPAGLPRALADADQISQVLINLMTNAAQSIDGAGRGSEIRLSARLDRRARLIELSVADDGPGVPQAIRGRIFDPLFTTKDVGQGTGIGLAFCHRVITSHGGQIRLAAKPAPGATFLLSLPLADDAGDVMPAPAKSRPAGRARVLVVDDEGEVAAVIRDILRRDGYEVEHAASAAAALARVAVADYAVILSDLNMPGLGGRGLFEVLARERPSLVPRLGFVTGDTMTPSARGFLDAAGRPFLEKPIAPADLRALVRRMIAAGAESTGR